ENVMLNRRTSDRPPRDRGIPGPQNGRAARDGASDLSTSERITGAPPMPSKQELAGRQSPDQPQQCPVCSKTNPATAFYCHFEGTPLPKDGRPGPVQVAALPFPVPFYFSDGQACATFNQLALSCASHWEEACALLGDGIWASWFRTIGRLDLAAAANR